jgi:galactokinase/galacturonokinase
MKCRDLFFETYKKEPEGVVFCPYRVCPIGAHSDHQYGKVTGFAIDKGIHIAYSTKVTGITELRSLQFDKRAQWHVNFVPDEKTNDWADYLRGATIMLTKKYNLKNGIAGIIEGDLPIGGLSSSAAVCIAYLTALCKVNGIKLTEKEMVLMAQSAENNYVGVDCGKMDQSCEIYSRANHLTYLDTKDDSYELIPISPKMKPFKIAIFFSGLERTLSGTNFNSRIEECRASAYALNAYEGKSDVSFKESRLRNVCRETYHRHKDKLPIAWQKRAEHFYTEFDRVEKGVEAWRKGDLVEFGKLCFESGKSSIDNWQTGSLHLIKLYEIMLDTDGIYGGRFSGAGIKGCAMALIDPLYEEQIVEKVTREYLREFPELEGKFSVHICNTADGVNL